MRLVKAAINAFTRNLMKLVPETEPKRPISQLTQQLFELIKESLTLNPSRFYADQNFPTLLDAARRTLIYLADKDGHYAGQLAQAYMLIYRLMKRHRRKFRKGPSGDIACMRFLAQHGTTKIKVVKHG